MNHPFKKNAKLVLSNGITFTGFSFGAMGSTVGEIVFNTGMTGYQEVITDPSSVSYTHLTLPTKRIV